MQKLERAAKKKRNSIFYVDDSEASLEAISSMLSLHCTVSLIFSLNDSSKDESRIFKLPIINRTYVTIYKHLCLFDEIESPNFYNILIEHLCQPQLLGF